MVWLATALCGVAHGAPQISADVVRQLTSVADAGAITDGVVTALARDATGYLWIGTPGGLLRYDGYRFRQFTYAAADPTSISGNFVRSLLVARDGRLWIGTDSDGLSLFDPATERFTRFQHRADDPASLQPGSVRALAEDARGAIWIGTTGGGLRRLDFARAHFTPVALPNDASGHPETRVSTLMVTASNAVWVGTWSGLAIVAAAGDTATAARFSADPALGAGGRNIQRQFQARDGRVWAGSNAGGVYVFDALSGTPVAAFRVDTDVTAIAQPAGDQVWIGHNRGIDLFDAAASRHLETLRHSPGEPDTLAAAVVGGLQSDHSGGLWIGTTGGGLQRLPIGTEAFALRRANLSGTSADTAFNVTSVLELADRQIWLGTGSNGVAAFDPQFALRGRLDFGGNAQTATAVFVSALAQTSDGIVWAAAPDGVYGFWPDRKRFRDFASSTWLGSAPIRRLFAAPDGRLWIGTSDGLFVMPADGTRIERSRAGDGETVHLAVNAMAQDAAGRLWVGATQGLFVIDHGSLALRAVAAVPGKEPAHASVLGLLIDAQQNLWLDTPEGIHRIVDWDGQQAAYERVSERLGIGGRPVGANLLEDAQGRIWTHKWVIDPAHDRAYPLSAADGFDLGTGWFRSYAATRDGRLLFGGRKGLLEVHPGKFKPWSYAPALVASELRVNAVARPAAALARTGLALAPGERSFSIEFSALDFSAPARNRYAYQLEGFDPDWIETDASRRVASYSNLWPGRYLLRVRGSNRIDAWSHHQMRIPITVSPAWWQTWWFAILLLAAVIGLVIAIVRARTASFARNRQRLEHEVRMRTRELEAATQALAAKTIALEEASLSDPLTGLRNRRFLAQHLAADIALCLRRFELNARPAAPDSEDADIVFFVVDIDHFKQVNDLHGHAAGDTVLIQVAQRLLAVFRESDYVVRWGGEEFLIVARATSRNNAATLAERVRQSIADVAFALADGHSISRTCSIGFAAFPFAPGHARALGWERVVEFADLAMYAVKHAGRNGWIGLAANSGFDPQRLHAGARDALLAEIRAGTLAIHSNLAHERVASAWHVPA